MTNVSDFVTLSPAEEVKFTLDDTNA